MIDLSPEQKERYFHRSFSVIDGLWFMKIEERYGFEAALEIDAEVWKIVPKIQARMIQEFGGLENGIDALQEAIATKLSLEGFDYSIETNPDNIGFTVMITGCPWHTMMVKSGREHLSEHVGNAICAVEYPAWAKEFGESITATISEKLCGGESCCRINFTQ